MRRALIVPVLWFVVFGYAEAGAEVSVKNLSYYPHKEYTRVVIDVNNYVGFTSHRLSNPERIYFDLQDAILTVKRRVISVNNNLVDSIRIAQFDRKTVRVVLDLKKEGKFYAFTLPNPYRLVIDVYSKEQVVERGREGYNVLTSAVKRVVIDPGHGGEDPGAVGPSGLMEKDVVLDISMKLGKILEEDYGLEVLYTRTTDVFIPLNERTEFANSKGSDLFISIHANASPSVHTKGIETYILNWTDDKEAMRVAARENAISINRMRRVHDVLQLILLDLAKNNKRDESIRLAHYIQNSLVDGLKGDYTWVQDLGVKQALFYVLIGAEMPSILIEVSFISNPLEERMLATDGYRSKIAGLIAKGVESYIKKSTLTVWR